MVRQLYRGENEFLYFVTLGPDESEVISHGWRTRNIVVVHRSESRGNYDFYIDEDKGEVRIKNLSRSAPCFLYVFGWK